MSLWDNKVSITEYPTESKGIPNREMLKKFREILAMLMAVAAINTAAAQQLVYPKRIVNADSVYVHFIVGKSDLLPNYKGNSVVLHKLTDSLKVNGKTPRYSFNLTRINIMGSASPEGSISINKRLSQSRADVIRKYIKENGFIPDSLVTYNFTGRNWQGLYGMALLDGNIPYKEKTMALLASYGDDSESNLKLRMLKGLEGGVPYNYMLRNIFPKLRGTKIYLEYLRQDKVPEIPQMEGYYAAKAEPPAAPALEPVERQTPAPQKKYFYFAAKSNLLYDLLITPNVGIEFNIDKNRKYSIAANWMYAWWKSDPDSWYHRTYGGDIAIRKWYGKKIKERPFTGFHTGIYGQMVTYDFEWGGRGYLGDRWSWAAGIEGGYSKQIGKKLNLDFNIGIGYLWGEYKEYLPIDGCYVWQATKYRRWIGPTKAEIQLVWIIGNWRKKC